MPDTLTGSCLCGAITYKVHGPNMTVANCHCKTCKKMSGGAFTTIAIIDDKAFEIVAGQDDLASYKISEQATKHFCRSCGTPIFNSHVNFPDHCMTAVGSLDDPGLATPAMNIFCESMLPWVKEIAERPCFAREPHK